MSITFQLPESLERDLRQTVSNLDDVAKEAAMVELYRQSKLTQHPLALALGLGRLEIDEVLNRHNVTEDLMTAEEFESQMAALRKLTAEELLKAKSQTKGDGGAALG